VRRVPLDGLLVPPLLLLIARELSLFDPTRELAWPLFHELNHAAPPAWLAALLPRPAPALYDDPLALLLATLAVLLATVYASATLLGARPRKRGALLALAAALLVALPTAAAIGLGLATGRPYGHDGGVVQLPLALEKVLAGESPYGADYAQGSLGEQSRDSVFWRPLGGNPITRHHWYLPGVHLVTAPFLVASTAAFGFFDPRFVTLLGYALAAWLAARLFPDAERRLAAAGLVLVHPLVFWPQIFGVNDVLSAVPLLLAAHAARSGQARSAAALVGFGAAFKQLSWPYAPFLLVYAAGIGSFRELRDGASLRRLAALAGIAASVFLVIVLPIALRDWNAFFLDIVRYQTGSAGGEQYPLGGTPGFGLANLLIYAGSVSSLTEFYPFSRFLPLLVPAGLVLLRFQFRSRDLAGPLAAGSAALLLSLYLSRIPNPNYVTLAAVFLPLALLLRPRLGLDVVLVPLLLLGLALEVATHQLLGSVWADGLGAGLPDLLLPHPGGPRWRDPLSTGWSGALAGLGILYLFASMLGLERRGRTALLAASTLIALGPPLFAVTGAARTTGIVRAQDRFLAEAVEAREAPGPGAWGHRAGVVRTPVVEAWPASWRKDPPRELPRELTSPGAYSLGRLARALGGVDPRPLVACGLLVAAVAWVWRGRGSLFVAGALLLSPPLAVALLFGSGAALAAALLAGALAATRGRALLAGAAAAPWPPLFVAGLALVSWPLGPAIGFLAAGAPLLIFYPAEYWLALSQAPPLEPSLGFTNLVFYRPDLRESWLPWLRPAGPLLLAGLALLFWRRGLLRDASLPAAATLATAALLVGPPSTGHAVAVPILLFLLVATEPNHGDGAHSM